MMDFIAMMQGRYNPPNVRATAKGSQAAARRKIASDRKSLTSHLASVSIFPAPSSDEVIAMYERFTDSVKHCYNVNVKLHASSNPACSVCERKFKLLLKKLSEIDSFPPPDVVDLNMDVLAEPDERVSGGSGKGKPKSSKDDGNDEEVKEKRRSAEGKKAPFTPLIKLKNPTIYLEPSGESRTIQLREHLGKSGNEGLAVMGRKKNLKMTNPSRQVEKAKSANATAKQRKKEGTLQSSQSLEAALLKSGSMTSRSGNATLSRAFLFDIFSSTLVFMLL